VISEGPIWTTTTTNDLMIRYFTNSSTAGTATTITYTFSTPYWKKPEPEPEPKPTVEEVMKNMKLSLPEPLPPKRYGTCSRCGVHLELEAFGGACSVCGGPLT